ncbi:MAG: hypothetical protein INR73_20125 [Williamsia sp.]|nr:hypothetical protein [Williamsia sp.]
MRQVFMLPVIFVGKEYYIQVEKYNSVLSIDFIISIDDPVLAELTGIRFCIFQYEPDEQNFEYYGITYLLKKPDMPVPNVAFEIAITDAIRAHERLDVKPAYYTSFS